MTPHTVAARTSHIGVTILCAAGCVALGLAAWLDAWWTGRRSDRERARADRTQVRP